VFQDREKTAQWLRVPIELLAAERSDVIGLIKNQMAKKS
jgi:hypothetical protein